MIYYFFKEINLYTVKEKELSLEAPYHIQINKTGVVDGFLTYFDIGFSHCVRRTGFSTGKSSFESYSPKRYATFNESGIMLVC